MVGAAPPEARIASLTQRANVAHSNAAYWQGEAEYWFDVAAEAHIVVRQSLGRALKDLRRTPAGRAHARLVHIHLRQTRKQYRTDIAEAAA